EGRAIGTPVWIAGGVGVASLAAAIVLRVMSIHAVHQYQSDLAAELMKPSSERNSARVRDGEHTAVNEELASNISFAAAGLGLAGAALFFLLDRDEGDAVTALVPSSGAPRGWAIEVTW